MRHGEIELEKASRSFSVRADRGRTLKELALRRGRGGPRPVRALHDVSLRVAPGETVGLVGRNGAGKWSTLKVLAGIIPLLEVAARPGAAPRWLVLEVRDAEGRRVFRTAAEPALTAAGGAVRFEIPRLALPGGDNDLAAGFAAPDADPEHYDRVQRFAVLREDGGEGLVDLRGAWSVADRAEAAS